MLDQPEIATMAEKLQQRSCSSRRSAWWLVVIMVLTVISLVFFFFGANIYSDRYITYTTPTYPEAEKALAERLSKESDEIKKMRLELDLKKAQLEQETSRNSGLTYTISSAVVRIGSVLIALYLVQILLSLTRYHLRLSDHLAACGHALIFSAGDPTKFVELVPILSASHIDFGKPPNTPTEKVIDVIKDALSKQMSGPGHR